MHSISKLMQTHAHMGDPLSSEMMGIKCSSATAKTLLRSSSEWSVPMGTEGFETKMAVVLSSMRLAR